MDILMEILRNVDPDIDYETEDQLIDAHIWDSIAVITVVSELEDAFDIRIQAVDMVPENFNSAEAIYSMVQRLQGE